MPTTTPAPKGLQDVVANESSICFIDGAKGILSYRGIDIHELAHQSNFEETCYLLWFGKLPTRAELRGLHDRMAEERKLDASIIGLLRSAPRHALPMDVLRTAVSALSFYDPQEKVSDSKANVDKAIRITHLHIIALIDLPQPDAAGYRRRDMTINKVKLGRIDLPLIGLHVADILLHQVVIGLHILVLDRPVVAIAV